MNTDLSYISLISLINFFIVAISLKYFISLAKKKKIYEINNEFIKKKKTVPTFGGIIFISTFILFFTISLFRDNFIYHQLNRLYVVPLLLTVLLIISLLDDKFNISSGIRFIVQVTVVFLSLTVIKFPLTNFIYLKLEVLLILYLWIFIINTSNFVDGLDGMLSINVIFFGIGAFLIIFLTKSSNIDQTLILSTSLIISSVLAFLLFNYPKAKIYMGDSGSIPTGYIIGLILLNIGILKDFYAALFLFTYPIIDVATTIVIKTLIKKKLPWARLFDYSFLQPVIKYKQEHKYVTNKIIFANSISLILLILYLLYNYKFLIIINFLIHSFLVLFFNKKLSFKNVSKINRIKKRNI
jgi:UDP-N-acetylmuramyl pentapeptide phosphotransferase/UDP-N-acetylglucosamine-1-phosphate transferase